MISTLIVSLALQVDFGKKVKVNGVKPVVVIAHRGNHVDVPENTYAAFEEGIKYHIDYVEMDLRTTKDGQLVIMHDGTVDRMTDGHGKVADLTLEEIDKLTIKGYKSERSQRVPHFDEVLDLCRGKIRIYLDFKEADVAQTVETLKKHRMLDQIIVYTGGDEARAWRKLAPKVPVITTAPKNFKSPTEFDKWLKSEPSEILDGPLTILDPEMLAVAKWNQVYIWPDVMRPFEDDAWWTKILEAGATGMQSDHPAALMEFLKRTGRRK